MDITIYLILLCMGVFTGFSAGLLGIGGGMVLVPMLTFILGKYGIIPAGELTKVSIATAMATILFTSISSAYSHHRKGAVRWDLVVLFVPGIVIAGFIGGSLFKYFNAIFLTAFFGLFVTYSAWKMFTSSSSKAPTITKPLPGRLGLFSAGAGIGFISGLVGAGGGFISVPYMTNRSVAMKNAVATSATLGFPIAFANTIGYIYSGSALTNLDTGMLGYIYLPALGTLVVASMLFAPVGAKVSHKLPVPVLKRIFACLLFVLAAYMLYKAYGLSMELATPAVTPAATIQQ